MTIPDVAVAAVAATATLSDAEPDVAFRMDDQAFRGFYDRTARLLWTYLHRLTGDRQLADDLLQETYYRFLRAGAALESDAHRRHYLFRIATNLARDGRRRTRSRPACLPVEGTDAPDARTSSATGALDRRLDVARALSRLSVRERALLWLAYAHGATHREIAEVIGVRCGSVKPLLYRARRRLASLLRPHEDLS